MRYIVGMIDIDALDCDALPSDGLGFGSAVFLGGALGWLLGAGRRSEASSFIPLAEDREAFSHEEKGFLSQIWRFEEEIDLATKNSNWERLFCLLHAASASLNQTWSKFLPEDPAYDPTPKFHAELDQLVMPLLDKMREGARLDFQSLLSPSRLQELEEGDLTFCYKTMAFTLNGRAVIDE